MTGRSLTESLRETLSVFDDTGTPLTTTEVADRLDLGRRSTYDRLERLVDSGRLATKKVGASARVWWQPPPDDDTVDRRGRLAESAPVELLSVAADGAIEYANSQARQTFGLDESADQTRRLADLEFYDVHGDPVSDGDHPARTLLEGDATVSDRPLRHETPAGDRRWVTLDGRPREDDEGAVVACTDLTPLQERQRGRDSYDHGLREPFDRVDDAFFALDEEWRFTHVNEQATALLDRPADELVGELVWEEFPEAVDSRFQTEYERAFETQESRSFEAFYPPLEAWFEVTAYPSETGLSVYFRDVTERVERERELERYETILETMDDGVYVVDDDGYFTDVTERYASMVGVDPNELVGRHVSTVVEDDDTLTAAQRLESELVSGERERASLEAEFETEDGDRFAAEATFSLLETDDGYERVGVVRDVTDRTARERELELYETIVETVDDAIYALDDDDRFVLVNQAFCDLTGYDRAELIGAHANTVHDEVVSRKAESMADELVRGERDIASIELDLYTRDGDAVPCECRVAPFPVKGAYGRCGVVRDVSERLDYERQLERRVDQQEVVATLGQRALDDRDVDALMAEAVELVAETLDNDYCKVLELDPTVDELLLRQGVGWDDGIVGSATVSAVADDSQASYTLLSSEPVVVEDLETEERFSGPALLTDHDVRSGISVVIGPVGDPWGILGTHDTASKSFSAHDVNFLQSVATILASAIARHDYETELVGQRTELRQREQTLRRAHEITADSDQSFDEQIDALLALVRETVGTDYAALSHVRGTDYVFEWVDTPADADLSAGDIVSLGDTNCERVVATEETLALQNVETDAPDLADRAGNAEWGISCYLGAPVSVEGSVYGTFCFYGMEARTEPFSDWEIALVDLISDWVGNELERRRNVELLSALNGLNEVINEITTAVIEQSTREEIEATVCEHLADSPSYCFAWIGEGDTTSQSVIPRAEAETGDYLDTLEITLDPDDERSNGPTGTALRTGEIQTVQDVGSDERYEYWAERAEAYGFQASAAVPIVHDETVYGVLNVYTDRSNAFEGRERVVLEQLGEVVGHAIAATQRKQALMSDEIVELEFIISDVFEALDIDTETQGTITFDHTIPVDDDEYLLYGSVTEDAVDNLRAVIETLPHWESVTFHGDRNTRFEARLSEPPVLSAVASSGGLVESAVIEDGDYRMSIHLSPSVDTRRIIDIVRDAYPNAQLLKRRQITRQNQSDDRLQQQLTESLTDRQLTALEAAYHAGFFEWPRDVSGEDVADSLDIAASTFHQHLRKAERKVFDQCLSTTMPTNT